MMGLNRKWYPKHLQLQIVYKDKLRKLVKQNQQNYSLNAFTKQFVFDVHNTKVVERSSDSIKSLNKIFFNELSLLKASQQVDSNERKKSSNSFELRQTSEANPRSPISGCPFTHICKFVSLETLIHPRKN